MTGNTIQAKKLFTDYFVKFDFVMKIKEKSSDTEVSELYFMVTRTGIEPMLPP